MARTSWLNKLYWRYLSKPASDRPIILHVLEHEVGSVLEIGLGTAQRTKTLLSLIQKPEGLAQVRYAGVDPFESAEDSRNHLKLKEAHRLLSECGVKAHLFPGDSTSALARISHTIQPSDLVIIDGGFDLNTDEGATIEQWLPRLVSESGTVFASASKGGQFQVVAVKREAISLRRAA